MKREVFSRNLGLNHLIFHRSHTLVSSIGVVQRGLRVRVPRARVCPLRRVNARPDCARAVCVRASLVPAPPLTHTQRRGIVAYCHVSSSTSRYRGRGAVIISNPKEHGRLLAPHPRVVRHPRKYNLTLDLMLILIISCCKLCFVIATRSTESISFSRV